jgi:hypothetical protein
MISGVEKKALDERTLIILLFNEKLRVGLERVVDAARGLDSTIWLRSERQDWLLSCVSERSETRLALERNEKLGRSGGHSDVMCDQDDRSTADDVASKAFLADPSSSLDVERRENIVEKEDVGVGVDGCREESCQRMRCSVGEEDGGMDQPRANAILAFWPPLKEIPFSPT